MAYAKVNENLAFNSFNLLMLDADHIQISGCVEVEAAEAMCTAATYSSQLHSEDWKLVGWTPNHVITSTANHSNR